MDLQGWMPPSSFPFLHLLPSWLEETQASPWHQLLRASSELPSLHRPSEVSSSPPPLPLRHRLWRPPLSLPSTLSARSGTAPSVVDILLRMASWLPHSKPSIAHRQPC